MQQDGDYFEAASLQTSDSNLNRNAGGGVEDHCRGPGGLTLRFHTKLTGKMSYSPVPAFTRLDTHEERELHMRPLELWLIRRLFGYT